MYSLKRAKCKNTADHTGDLQRQLLGWGKAIDAVCDRSLKRIGKRQVFEVHKADVNTAFLICDHQGSRITQRVRKLFCEKWMPFRFFTDQTADHGWDRF